MGANTITWTIAYRKPRANHFKRVTNWSGTWDEARDMADRFAALNPTLQVWYTTSAAYEAAKATELAERLARGAITQAYADDRMEDHGNILIGKKRIQIRETGELPAELLPAPAEVNHDALAPFVGLLVQDHRDGSWNPYSQAHQGDTVAKAREMGKRIYGGTVTTRVVIWTARVLCDNRACPGHDGPEDSCPDW